jgi:membrane protein
MVNTNIEVKKMNKIFKSILLFVLAFLFLLLGVAILPLISNLGENILYLFVGFSILIYTYGLLLIKRVVKAKGTIYVISLTETILLTMIALFSIINFFVDMNIISNASIIMGIAILMRCVTEVIVAYYITKENKTYSLSRTLVNILLTILGTMFIASSTMTNNILIYAFSAIFVVSSVATIVMGVVNLKNKTMLQ